jgi:hypothetical protein
MTGITAGTSNLGLYYPRIHFYDEEWLKLAVLYWEGLTRIVPRDYDPHDSPAVQELQRSAPRFIRPRAPRRQEMNEVAMPFADVIKQRAPQLREKFAVHREGSKVLLPSGVASDRELLDSKVARSLREALVDEQLALAEREASGHEAFFMHPRIADVYMAALAAAIARSDQLHPVSDEPAEHLAMGDLTVERLTTALLDEPAERTRSSEINAAMAIVSLKMVLPRSLKHVSFDQLVRFREDHTDELTAFQDFVTELTGPNGQLAGVESVEDVGSVEAHLEEAYRRRVLPQVNELEGSLNGIGIDTVQSVAAVTLKRLLLVPGVGIGAAVGGVALAPGIAPVFATGLVGLSVFNLARRSETSAANAVDANPAAYLVYAREELTHEGILARLKRGARKFLIRR